MKSFHQFQEDINQLKRDLGDLERQSAPSERLSARRDRAKEKIKNMSSQFTQNVARKQDENKERAERLAQDYEERRKKKDS
jgi:hypothetical protein